MLQLLLKKLIWAFFSFAGIALAVFALTEKLSPDPLLQFKEQENTKSISEEYKQRVIQAFEEKHGLQLPAFYISVQAKADAPWVPLINWNGITNRFHKQFVGFFTGDWGYSYRDSSPVSSKIKESWQLSIWLGITGLLAAFVAGTALGLYMASQPKSKATIFIRNALFVAQLMPVYLLAFVLIYLFSNKELLYLLPSYGMAYCPPTESCFWQNVPYLVLPFICYVLIGIGYVGLTVETAATEVLQHDYVVTARAMGYSKNYILRKVVLANIMYPLLSLFGALFPAYLGGSVLIESLFTLPGMGKLAFTSFMYKDIPVAVCITLITAALSLLGYVLAEMMFYLTDPKLRDRATFKTVPW